MARRAREAAGSARMAARKADWNEWPAVRNGAPTSSVSAEAGGAAGVGAAGCGMAALAAVAAAGVAANP